jgi:hypothetical protein
MAKLKTLNDMLSDNPDLLSFVEAPADLTDIDNAALKLAVIRRCGDVEPYYQTESDFMLFGLLWFSSHRFLFSHALDIWNAQYNPIENYDRHETTTEEGAASGTKQNTDTHGGTDTTQTTETRDKTDTHTGTDTDSTTISTTDTTTHGGTDSTITENEIAGFNSTDYSDNTKETANTTHGETINVITSGTNSASLQHGEIITTDEDNSGTNTIQHGHTITTNGSTAEETTNSRESHIHGNIGVTTAQQMISAELELANHFWLYDYIASAFESENFITAYNNYFGGY